VARSPIPRPMEALPALVEEAADKGLRGCFSGRMTSREVDSRFRAT
jgi:hypothetical protein